MDDAQTRARGLPIGRYVGNACRSLAGDSGCCRIMSGSGARIFELHRFDALNGFCGSEPAREAVGTVNIGGD